MQDRERLSSVAVLARAAQVLADGGQAVVGNLLTLLAEALQVPRAAVAVQLPPSPTVPTLVGVGVAPVRAALDRSELPLRAGGRLVGTLVFTGVPASDVAAASFLTPFADLIAAAVSRRGSIAAEPADLEPEFAAVAGALHDGPVQTLLAARFAAELAARRHGDDLGDVPELVTDALHELRRVMWELRPRTKDGLACALEELAAHHAADSAPRMLSVSVDPAADARLTPAAAALAYRLTQGVLGTSTSATRVAVRTTRTGVTLQISGADADIPDVDRWQRRTAQLGGRLTVERGRVRLDLPGPAVEPSPGDVTRRSGSQSVPKPRPEAARRTVAHAGGSR